jgi:hypothetical protein
MHCHVFCEDLVLNYSQFGEAVLAAAVAVTLENHQVGGAEYEAVRVVEATALVGVEGGYYLFVPRQYICEALEHPKRWSTGRGISGISDSGAVPMWTCRPVMAGVLQTHGS